MKYELNNLKENQIKEMAKTVSSVDKMSFGYAVADLDNHRLRKRLFRTCFSSEERKAITKSVRADYDKNVRDTAALYDKPLTVEEKRIVQEYQLRELNCRFYFNDNILIFEYIQTEDMRDLCGTMSLEN